MMQIGSTGHPRLLRDRDAVALVPMPFDSPEMAEAWLQQHLNRYPELLPIEEISAAWGPLISLGQEVPLPVGFVDNLYASPAGEVTVVEAKLWRNPEARRKVIGQILDYAAALAAMSYEGLQEAVREATTDDRTIWQRVVDSQYASIAVPEASFVDTVSRNLRMGRFLLLVVGDGIRSDLHSLAELLSSQPGLGFHLELVELRCFAMPDGAGVIAVPSLVGRTAEVARVVVDVRNESTASVSVVVESPVEAQGSGTLRIASIDEFVSRAADAIGQDRAEAIGDLAGWWRRERGGLVKLGKQSMNLSAPYRHSSGKSVSVMTVRLNGIAEGSVAPIAEWRGLIGADDALARYQAAGFAGDPRWPKLSLDLTQAVQVERVRSLLEWAAALIRDADLEPPPTKRPTV